MRTWVAALARILTPLLALVTATLACSGHPTAPSVDPKQVVRVVAGGPGTVAPGATIHITLFAYRVDGSSIDVTAQATWTSSNPEVLRVSGGDVVGVEDGEATITAQYLTFTSTRVLTTMEAGPFAVGTTVSDDSGFSLAGARVDVLSGTGAGKFATTDSRGYCKLYGLAGPVRLQASVSGYQAATKDVMISSSFNTVISLIPVDAPADVSGSWQMSIDASPSCGTLPDAARHRTYVAGVEQKVSALQVQLSGATFAKDPAFGDLENTFFGRAFLNTVTLRFETYQYYGLHYDLGEILPDGGVYTVVGVANGIASATSVDATLSGAISVTGTPQAAACTADHHLRLTRTGSLTGRR